MRFSRTQAQAESQCSSHAERKTRPGTTRESVDAALSGARYVWLDAAELDIEATRLRERARSYGSLRFLVRDGVWRYIVEKELYEG